MFDKLIKAILENNQKDIDKIILNASNYDLIRWYQPSHNTVDQILRNINNGYINYIFHMTKYVFKISKIASGTFNSSKSFIPKNLINPEFNPFEGEYQPIVNKIIFRLKEILLDKRAENIIPFDDFSHTVSYLESIINMGHIKALEILLAKMPSNFFSLTFPWFRILELGIKLKPDNQKEMIEKLLGVIPLEVINSADVEGETLLHKAAQLNNNKIITMFFNMMNEEAILAINSESKTAADTLALIGNDIILTLYCRIEKLANLLIKYFHEDPLREIAFEDYRAFHFYQKANKEILQNYLENKITVLQIDNYITNNPLKLNLICKTLNSDSVLAVLPSECIARIFSLAEHYGLIAEEMRSEEI